jgi:hypothetical protein
MMQEEVVLHPVKFEQKGPRKKYKKKITMADKFYHHRKILTQRVRRAEKEAKFLKKKSNTKQQETSRANAGNFDAGRSHFEVENF